MRVLSHRGLWQQPAEKNTLEALRRSFEQGIGTETDIRDWHGSLVIAHDMPTGGEASLAQVLELMRATACRGPLALNVKADGLQQPLQSLLAAYADIDCYVFDMSMPETLAYARAGTPFYLRASEYERKLPPLAGARGVWLDAFHGCWYDAPQLADFLELGEVCVVSADLHRRPHLPHWRQLRDFGLHDHPHLSLCTDHPEAAHEFFNT